ncbi:MAG: hypothetical protein Q8M03_05505, partial [Legionella sp.]|nr:hypothetical protein [Legionella sp.]
FPIGFSGPCRRPARACKPMARGRLRIARHKSGQTCPGCVNQNEPKRDSESERDFHGAFRAARVSPHFSLFQRHGSGQKSAPATARPAGTYKTIPIPIRIEAAVNFSRFDFEAKEDWLPGRGALREGEREIGQASPKCGLKVAPGRGLGRDLLRTERLVKDGCPVARAVATVPDPCCSFCGISRAPVVVGEVVSPVAAGCWPVRPDSPLRTPQDVTAVNRQLLGPIAGNC